MMVLANFIDNQFFPAASGKMLEVEEPAKATVYATVPDSGEKDLDKAVDAAEKAFPIWATFPIAERSRILHRLADLIDENLEDLAIAESRDTGKPVSLAIRMDIPRAAANFRFFASAIVNFASEAHLNEGHSINYTRRAPIGIVGCISPWNLPLYLFTWKIAPALAAGNCVIGKPSELTPYTAYLLSELAIKAGLPAGVLSILHGRGASIGQAIVDHPKISAISFTGGTETGRLIGTVAAQHFKKVSLELGGKNPILIFSDCDFEEAVLTTVRSSFTNQGEICLCGSRILVELSLFERFKKRFLEEVANLVVGNPEIDKTDIGSLISENHLKKVTGFVDRARASGQQILIGGKVIDRPGHYYQPTVIQTDRIDCEINQTEVFGPVVTLMPFSTEQEGITLANNTVYGLASVIWTQDLKRAHRVAHSLKSGIVWVNCWMDRDLRTPFGGMKFSGVGREGGSEALRFFTEPQNITIRL